MMMLALKIFDPLRGNKEKCFLKEFPVKRGQTPF